MTKAKGKNRFKNRLKNRLILLQTTTTEENAKILINKALESKLTACIQESKIQSHYFWRDNVKSDFKLHDEAEILLTFKVFKRDFKALKKLILRFHAYEIPEILAFKPHKVSQAYKKWFQSVREANDAKGGILDEKH